MEEIRTVKVHNREVEIVISDEKEALLAAKAAGRAVVGLWDPKRPDRDLGPVRFLLENPEDADGEYLERVARRHLGLPWNILETERTRVREMRGEDYSEIWDNQVGHGFSSLEELEAYTKNQYEFYGFGFWAVVEKKSGELIGIAGVRTPGETDGFRVYSIAWEGTEDGCELEIGYHIFVPWRRRGYGEEVCRAVLQYAREELYAEKVTARIREPNTASVRLALALGMTREI